jgi:VCBS repeat protein
MKGVFTSSVRLVFSFVFVVMMTANIPVLAQVECNSLGAPLVTTGSIAGGDADQTLRLFRDGRGTTCLFNRPQTTSAGTYDHDTYTFTNDTGGPACIFVDLDATGCGVATNQISMSAYLGSYNPASILTNVIADPGLSTGQNFSTSMNFSVAAGATYVIVVHNINAGTACANYTFRRYVTNNCRQAGFDAANDGNADLALFRPSGPQSTWWTQPLGGAASSAQLGSTGDVPVDGDYTGDETSDVAVFRGSNGTWYTSLDPGTNYGARLWGTSGDVPVPGDYDRDGLTDLAVFRPSTNTWFVLRSSTSTYHEFVFGSAGDRPVPADFDGDGRMDPALWRPSNGLWTSLSSSGNYGSFVGQILYGTSTDIPVPADYDGDGKADAAIFRPSEGNWYVFRSSVTAAQSQVTNWGASGDMPQPADYDNDKKADLAVFRPSTGTWWINRSTAGAAVVPFGQIGDVPTTSPVAHVP